MASSLDSNQASSNLEKTTLKAEDVHANIADFDDSNIDRQGVIVNSLEDDSTHPAVRSVVANTDDSTVLASTLRVWALGLVFTVTLSYLPWICWIAPNNLVVNQLFAYVHALGVNLVAFDWAQVICSVDPFATPWWTEASVTVGFVFVMWFITPILYCTNVWYCSYLPMLSGISYNNTSGVHNVARIINADVVYSKVDQLHSRAETLVCRFQQGWENSDIEEAITLDRESLEHCPPGHPKRAVSLTQLSTHLCTRYNRLGEIRDIEEAIIFEREALSLRLMGCPDRSLSLHNIARYLWIRHGQQGATEDLDEAIILCREALDLRPPGHSERSMSLHSMATYLYVRYERYGAIEDLQDAIILDREALQLRPPGHPDRSLSLNNLAIHLSIRFKQYGAIEDHEDAIALYQEALELRSPGHPDRSMSLNNLAIQLCIQYEQRGTVEDLEEAIVLHREALQLRPPGHPGRWQSLHNLGIRLCTRYVRHGVIEDLDEAIVLVREALSLLPPSHPNRTHSLNNLGLRLWIRYQLHGATEDLDEAIVLCREALDLLPPGYPRRSEQLNNLALFLSERYREHGAIQDIDEAVALNRATLRVRPPGHPYRPITLGNLARSLCYRYKRHGAIEDLDETIIFGRQALREIPLGHKDRPSLLNRLAGYLSLLYEQCHAIQELEDAIVLGREALHRQPLSCLGRSEMLKSLASNLSHRFRQSKELGDKEGAFGLYLQLTDLAQIVTSTDLAAAKSWIGLAEEFDHPTLLAAYETSLRLLVLHLATLPSLPQHLNILRNLTSSLAVDAFSACLRHHRPAKAVEFLEQGRGVFWSQLARLRSPLEEVIASGQAGKSLADRFSQLALHIRNALNSSEAGQHDRVYHLNIEMQKVVTKIRELPGFSRFLLPSRFSDLQHAASGGPVIIINASKHSCDALVIFLDQDPVHIPLRITQLGVRNLSEELHTLTMRAKTSDVSRDLALFLRKLWDEIVSPIVDFLQTTLPSQSRIWWCPTAEFSLLPLHAAAPYRSGQRQLAQIYVSSYTPTLTALIQARRPNPSDSLDERKRFTAIGQANAAGEGELPSVGAELDDICKRVDGVATFRRMDGEESCIARMAEELKKNEWVHLACHGIPNTAQPFQSAFALRDGRFTIQRIIGCELKNPEFAYLSACHTTVGDKESPDEVIHLAAAMQFAGFRSVIGTMWAVDDGETNKITSTFHKYMVNEFGRLDHTRAAYALNRTMRSVNIPLDQRILYIHLGA